MDVNNKELAQKAEEQNTKMLKETTKVNYW